MAGGGLPRRPLPRSRPRRRPEASAAWPLALAAALCSHGLAQGALSDAPTGSGTDEDFALVEDGGSAEAAVAENDDYCRNLELWAEDVSDVDVCTTVTSTSTTTTATTTTTLGRVTTTTTPQPRECRALCEPNGHPWFVKCGWKVCATCEPCANVVVPTSSSPRIDGNFSWDSTSTLPPTTQFLPSTTTSTTLTTAQGSAGGGASAGGATTTTTTIDLFATSTGGSATVPMYGCVAGCVTDSQPWTVKCDWASCAACSQCGTSTVSTTTSSTSTTSTATSTSTTFTTTLDPFATTTSTLTLTQPTTSTKSSTTSTSTTSTMTTTAPWCDPPSTIFPTRDCQDRLAPGRRCVAHAIDHPCVAQGNMTFFCPADNSDPRHGPRLENGTYALRCRVCGMREPSPVDEDGREGHFKTRLYWGPNTLAGAVDEAVVTGYFVYFADDCSRKLGKPLAYVPKGDRRPSLCCQYDLYSAEVASAWPAGVDGNVTLMVVPDTEAGELSVGVATEPLEDLVMQDPVVVRVARTSGAISRGGGASAILALALLASAAWIFVAR